MKFRYGIHPGEYAIGENELYYSEMAAKGWRLRKRGQRLSRFERAEPETARYRIEIAASGVFDDLELPEDKISLFEECGWEFVTRFGYVNVFRASKDSDMPEFYMEPQQQAQTMRAMRRSYLLSPIIVILTVVLWLLMWSLISGNSGVNSSKLGLQILMSFVENTAYMLLLTFILIFCVYSTVYGAVRTISLYRKLKKGIPLEHSPKHRHNAHKTVCLMFSAAICMFAVLLIVQWATYDKYDMPEYSDGSYIVLSDIGIEGSRTFVYQESNTSEVKVTRSLAARHWDTFECVNTWAGKMWIYQDIYELEITEIADKVAFALMENGILARGRAAYEEIDVQGLDSAYYGGLEFVGVKGDVVFHVEYLSIGEEPDEGAATEILRLLGEKQKQK